MRKRKIYKTIDSLLKELNYQQILNKVAPPQVTTVIINNVLYEGGFYGCERVKRYKVDQNILYIHTY